jgi:hypothetical protein
VQFRAQLQEPEQVQVRMDEWAQVRGPVIIRERGQERPPFSGLERRLLRAPERGPHRGQEFPPWSGRRGEKERTMSEEMSEAGRQK